MVEQGTCEVGLREEAQGCEFPAGEEQQNCFESAAGRELPFFSIQDASSCCSAAHSAHGLAGETPPATPAHNERQLLLFQVGRALSSLQYFYLALCQAQLVALLSGALVLPFPQVLLLNLII